MASSSSHVILRACADYDADRIATIVGEGLDTFGLRPFGKTLIKPNVVAAGPYFPHAYTRPEFVEGVARALHERDEGMSDFAVGERSGITVPTRYAFAQAGFYDIAKRVPSLKFHHFDEVSQVEIGLSHDGRLRDRFYTPAPVAAADFFVNCPKFKAHPWTTVTFSMKNYIGIQDDRHRLIDHDHKLNQKVADLQYIVQPQFIAVDAITAGEGRMLTPLPYELGLIIMANNQVACDTVASWIAGVAPREVEHIRLASERGFGPMNPNAILISGDVSLDEAKERAANFRTGLIRVEDYFEGTNIRAYAGPPPSDTDDYCWGGCPGALEEAIEILRVADKSVDEKIRPLHIVFGNYKGKIHAGPDEKIVFMGDCAQFHGAIGGRDVRIDSAYVDRATKEPLDAKHDGAYAKMLKVGWNMFRNRHDPVVRIRGCPVSVSEQVITLLALSRGAKNPYFQPEIAVPFTSSYLSWKSRVLLKRLMGQPYNQEGPALRGQAKPRASLPLVSQ
jgi:uncharacterized protein (DUF362 family)